MKHLILTISLLLILILSSVVYAQNIDRTYLTNDRVWFYGQEVRTVDGAWITPLYHCPYAYRLYLNYPECYNYGYQRAPRWDGYGYGRGYGHGRGYGYGPGWRR